MMSYQFILIDNPRPLVGALPSNVRYRTTISRCNPRDSGTHGHK